MKISALSRIAILSVTMTLPITASAAVPGTDALGSLIAGQFDANNDGEIDGTEWENGIADGFDSLDADDSGKVTSAEINQLSDPIRDEHGELGAILIVALVKAIMLTFDTDEDGSVSREEYAKQTRGLLKRIDIDGSGTVSESELLELPAKLLGSE